MRELTPRSISIRKGGRSNSTSEVSETTKVCTDEQKLDMRHSIVDKVAHHTKVRRIPKRCYVDSAGINRRLFILPGELLPISNDRRKSAEVIVVSSNEPVK
jgi:hypothetical protein